MRLSPRRVSLLAIVLLGLLFLAGCSRSLLTAPATTAPRTSSSNVTQPPPPPSLLGGSLPVIDKLLSWTTITQMLVIKDQVTVVTGHRWSLEFEKGSLLGNTLVTIEDYDPDILDVQFGPHGTQFLVPVTLSVDFSNTAADPGAAHYDGSEPVLYWLNDRTNAWELMPGRVDWASKKLIVRLPHFSRYVVGGKAGWKQTPNRDDN
jgi:hypothetical protein